MSEPIRVLYVIENERYGGGERAFAQLINGLDKNGFEVYAACLADKGNPAAAVFLDEVSSAARVTGLDLRRLYSPGAVTALKKIIFENKIGVVHSQGARADFYARLAAHGTGAAAVSTIASPVEEYDVGVFRKTAYTALDRFSSRYTSKFVAVAEHIRRKLISGRGLTPDRVVRIYNGVDVSRYDRALERPEKIRSKYGIPADSFLVAAFCRLSPEKGLFTLAEAAAATVLPGGKIKYLLAGEGPLEAKLRSRVRELGSEKDFIFTGFLGDVKPLLCAADLAVLPSLREGFPMSLLEAMAAGKPVVASDIEGIDESVENGRTGLLVPPGNSAALAAAIKDLAANPARARQMGAAGRAAAAAKFGEAGMVKAYEDMYREISCR